VHNPRQREIEHGGIKEEEESDRDFSFRIAPVLY
jgi:hypothetical protein